MRLVFGQTLKVISKSAMFLTGKGEYSWHDQADCQLAFLRQTSLIRERQSVADPVCNVGQHYTQGRARGEQCGPKSQPISRTAAGFEWRSQFSQQVWVSKKHYECSHKCSREKQLTSKTLLTDDCLISSASSMTFRSQRDFLNNVTTAR